MLAMISDEKERQSRAYRKIIRTTVLISFSAVFGLAAVSESFVLTLIGEQWIPAAGYLRILCMAGLFIPLMICSANIINADGRSDITLYLEIFKTSLAVFPVLAGIFISIEALLWTTVAVSAISYLAYAVAVSRLAGYPVLRQLKDIFPFFAVSAVMAAAVFCFSFLSWPQWLILLVQIAAGVSVVVFSYEVIYRNEEYSEVKTALLKFFK